MEFIPTKIPDVIMLRPQVVEDSRGFALETYRDTQFDASGLPQMFVQEKHTSSYQGVIRGLHYQITRPQGKLVRVVIGQIFNVAVDLRQSSPTFGQWVGAILSEENKYQVWVPPGFAHGFCALSRTADVIHKLTAYDEPEWERCLLWNDPQVNVMWPLYHGGSPILSEGDVAGRPLAELDLFD
ncbi:MAG: dTDP-4-dehydrorhamnose 3,5-epimerase [Anaerolineales bacterium]|nr:dTDP-4-dehydrorhamnose 3,5-epimerase [Anaerolineales bacterium]